ncbi:MAG TPA: hypothetical protein VH081_02865 [Solirubrobacteraceae bacterium]|jgi:hypothetical protein|nr:hypothetical protein [Solirubrobacteraceae bacterium]
MLGARVLVVLASALLLLSILATWVRSQIIDTGGWTQTSVRVLNDEAVRGAVSSALSERLLSVIDTRELAAEKLPPALAPLAGALSSAAAEVVPEAVDRALQTPALQEAWAHANKLAHAQVIKLLDGGGSALSTSGGVVAINLEKVLDELGSRLGVGHQIGAKLPPDKRRLVLLRSKQLHHAQVAVRGLRDLSLLLPLLVVLGFLGALWIGVGVRRRVLLEIGAGIVAAALVSLLLRRFIESYVVDNLIKSEGLRPAVRQVLAILTEGWASRALWLLVTGVIVLFAGLLAGPARWASWLRRQLADPLERHTAWFAAGAFAIVFVIAVVGPTRTPGQALPLLIELILAIVGVFALRAQVRRELVAGFDGGSETASSAAEDAAADRSRISRSTWFALVAAGVVLVLVVVLIVVDAGKRDGMTASAQLVRCNGSHALCARRLDQVVFPATHNSMSAADEGFRVPNQATGIAEQLAGGIRGLLIDTHMGVSTSKGVYTVLRDGQKSREQILEAIGPAATASALAIRAGLGYRGGGSPQVYLCHGYCEIGASPALLQFQRIRDFLTSHPGEVLVISVEDDTSAQAFAAVVQQSGLLPLVWKGSVSPPPTLGEMVAKNQRVLFMAENEPGDVPWLHAQFSLAQETNYAFKSPGELLGAGGCVANRGGTTPALFLINMFVDTFPPSRTAPATLNQRSTIVAHARSCEAQRDRTPTLIAVDQWQDGDVVGAARELNADG